MTPPTDVRDDLHQQWQGIAVQDFLYAALSIQRGGAPTPWETCSTLIEHRKRKGDVIAAVQPGSYLELMLRSTFSKNHVFIHSTRSSLAPAGMTRDAQIADAGEPAIILGPFDRDIISSQRPWPVITKPSLFRQRSIDTLYGDSHEPAVIVVEADVIDVLTGALTTLERYYPDIIINFAELSIDEATVIADQCVDLLARLNYRWYDGFLLPCETAQRRRDLLSAFASRTLCARPVRSSLESLVGMVPVSCVVPQLAARDWKSVVETDSGRGRISLPLDNSISSVGLYSAETDGVDLWWRWSGPTAQCRLVLPLPAGGFWYLQVDVLDWGVASDHSDLSAYAFGKELVREPMGATSVRFGPVAIPLEKISGRLVVDISMPPPRRASNQDPRRIGVNFCRVALERAA